MNRSDETIKQFTAHPVDLHKINGLKVIVLLASARVFFFL